jgi:hypothetical protein
LPKTKTIRLNQYALCPCGSGKLLRDCCLLPGGGLRKQPPTLHPPPPRTGYAQSGCYLGCTMDCSTGLSAEHYMSRSVLEAIGTSAVAIDGAPWLSPGERRAISIDRLTAKILCSRHNSALSPLDSAAGEFFKKLQIIHSDLQRKSLSLKHSFVIMSGETLELWMLKLACGLFYSKNAAQGGAPLIDDHTVNKALVEEALLRGRWHGQCGLYMKAPQGLRVPVINAVSMAPLTALTEPRVVGASVIITGLEFELIFDPIGISMEALSAEGWVHRPSELLFGIETRAHSIELTWVPGTPPKSIRMINRPARI